MQIVFQDPQSSLDRRLPVWRLISEPLHIRGGLSRTQLYERAHELALSVGLRPEHLDRLPHEFSGGQRQRIAIARALSTSPDLMVLDEPTSALDVSVQAQIINLLLALQRDRGLSYLMISHDVALVRHFCDDVAVMYLGEVVESGPAQTVLHHPRHPYTQTLLAAVPSLTSPLPDIAALRPGELPGNRNLPSGCFYKQRCDNVAPGCDARQQLRPLTLPGHQVRCHKATG
jgi:peptide/nickel transport system ATP-binding protein